MIWPFETGIIKLIRQEGAERFESLSIQIIRKDFAIADLPSEHQGQAVGASAQSPGFPVVHGPEVEVPLHREEHERATQDPDPERAGLPQPD